MKKVKRFWVRIMESNFNKAAEEMKVKVLGRNFQSLKDDLAGKRRIMTYGAGIWANDIKKMLAEYGYRLDYAIVDNQYRDKGYIHVGDTDVISIDNLRLSYNPESDMIIWAIGSPEKLRNCMKEPPILMECYLVWDMGFWKEKDYSLVHKNEFQEACELLYDEYSKKVFRSYIKAQKGNIDEDIRYSTNGTYFNELTKVRRGGAFLDCGSYDGSSAIEYMKFADEECLVYAFEPDKENYQNLTNRVKDRPNVICLNKGCYSSDGTLSFASNGDMSSSLHESGTDIVEVTTIDSIVGEEKVAFIKMDIEGAELEALKGARNVIRQNMPVLAISAYHRQEDLITLLPYISNLRNEREGYHLYLRHHGVGQTELVIYAIPFSV